MINIGEYSRYMRMYQKKMCEILEKSGVELQDSSRRNIVALRYFFEAEGMLKFYPTLEKVLNAVNDCAASPEFKLEVMQDNITEAFKKVEPKKRRGRKVQAKV
ncbi:MAG: hypothetical protein IJ809_01280 [Clostridia bacterium]|nr:hypothetical protein [Clostridia bacterium]